MGNSGTGDRRMQFLPGFVPTREGPKKSLFDPGGCPFTLFREKIGRGGKIFLRNFMDFAKKILRNQNGTLLADSHDVEARPRNPAEKIVRDLWVDSKENGKFRFSDTEIGPISDTCT